MEKTRRRFMGVTAGGVVAAIYPKAASASSSQPLPEISFIQVSDTHIPDRSGLERTPKVIAAIDNFSMPYDFVVHTGDLSTGHGREEDLLKAKELLKFKKKTYFVPGNHDVTFDRSHIYEPKFEEIFGVCNYGFTPTKGLRCVLFNSQAISDQALDSTREKAFSKLTALLKDPIPTILFCHATGLPDFYGNEMHEGWRDETMARWTRIMRQGNVFCVLAAHFHRDEYHVSGSIPFHITGPVVGWWGRQATFRYWSLKNGVLSYRTIYV